MNTAFHPRVITRLAMLLAVAVLAGCSTSSPDVVSRNEAQRLATITDAVVLSPRPLMPACIHPHHARRCPRRASTLPTSR